MHSIHPGDKLIENHRPHFKLKNIRQHSKAIDILIKCLNEISSGELLVPVQEIRCEQVNEEVLVPAFEKQQDACARE